MTESEKQNGRNDAFKKKNYITFCAFLENFLEKIYLDNYFPT